MRPLRTQDPRRLVLHLLAEGGRMPSRRFGEAALHAGLSPVDRGLAHELLLGVLRRRATLDAVMQAHLKKRLREPRVRDALHVGLYQLVFLDRVPPHAAIHTTLEAMKPGLEPRIGLVNAVLRAVQRGMGPGRVGARDRWTLTLGPERAVRFVKAVFPDPERDPVGWLAAHAGFPRALVKRWLAAAGEETTRMRLALFDQPAPLWLRPNPGRMPSPEAVREALAAVGVETEPRPGAPLWRVLRGAGSPADWPGFAEGWWSVQDLSAWEAVMLAEPRPGERVLDLCAAPGGKAFAVLEATGGEARVTACDVDEGRLAELAREAARLGHAPAVVPLGDDAPAPEGAWDLIVADVPCTNTGVLHKRPEARGRFDDDELHRATTVQNLFMKQRLVPAVAAARAAGARPRVLWSTCSLEPEENGEMARRLAKRAGLELAAERTFEPSPERSGGYAALLVTP